MATQFGANTPLWEPSEEAKQQANLTQYMQWLQREKGLAIYTRAQLWQWSVSSLEDFWASLWEYFHIKASKPYTAVLLERKMPGATWFPGAELNVEPPHKRSARRRYRPTLRWQPWKAISTDSMSNPQSIQYFIEFAHRN